MSAEDYINLFCNIVQHYKTIKAPFQVGSVCVNLSTIECFQKQ